MGDYYPVSSHERVICIGVMILGLIIHGLLGHRFFEMLQSIRNFESEYEESSALERFFEVMK
jgi:hypothetical protein